MNSLRGKGDIIALDRGYKYMKGPLIANGFNTIMTMQRGRDSPFVFEARDIKEAAGSGRKILSKEGAMSAHWATRKERHGDRDVDVTVLAFKENKKITLLQTTVPEFGPEFWTLKTRSLNRHTLAYDKHREDPVVEEGQDSASDSSSARERSEGEQTDESSQTSSSDEDWFPGVEPSPSGGEVQPAESFQSLQPLLVTVCEYMCTT